MGSKNAGLSVIEFLLEAADLKAFQRGCFPYDGTTWASYIPWASLEPCDQQGADQLTTQLWPDSWLDYQLQSPDRSYALST